MANTLDVYRDWLKIPEADRPLSHYQLLRLKKFEDNPAKVREHYRKMNTHVRKYAAGEFAKQSQELLNELARAMLCLTDARRKEEYDATLGRQQAADTKARSFETILLANQVVDQAALDKARNFAKAIGVDVRDALVQQRLAKYEAVLPAYAESIGLPYLDLSDIPLNTNLIARVPPVIARQHSCIPVMIDDNHLLMASPNPIDPNVEEELRLRFNMPVRTVLCTPANVDEVINKYVPRDGSAVEPMPAPVAATATAGQATTGAAAAPAKAAPTGPMTPEEKTERRNYSILAMNAGTFGFILFYQVLGWGLLMSLPIAIVLAGAGFGIVWKMKSH